MTGRQQALAALSPVQLAELHARLRRTGRDRPVIRSRPDGRGEAVLSTAQERLWFLQQLSPGSVAYNMTEVLRLRGTLDVRAMETAFRTVLDRHEVLRTAIVDREGTPVQVVRGTSGERVLRTADAIGEDDVLGWIRTEESTPFELAAGTPCRAVLLRLSGDHHVLVLTIHHIVADGWSFRILLDELSTVYRTAAGVPTAAPPPLTIQYADYAVWERDRLATPGRLDRLRDYWRNVLAGAPGVLEMPGARPRPERQSFAGAGHVAVVPQPVTDRFLAVGSTAGCTPFMAFLAAFLLALGHRCDRTDLVVGTDVANRGHGETAGLIGMFVNQLALRVDLAGIPTVPALLDRVRRTVLDAFDHQEMPFQTLVADIATGRRQDRNPLFQIVFILQEQVLERVLLHDVIVEPMTLDAPTTTTAFDLSAHLTLTADGARVLLRYATDLYDAETVVALEEDFQVAVATIAGGIESIEDLRAELDAVELARSARGVGRARRSVRETLRNVRRVRAPREHEGGN